MAVWKRSTRRRGSYSSNSSVGSVCYKPTSPVQASTAPSKANLPLNYHRNESRSPETNYLKKRKYNRSSDMVRKRGRPPKHLVGLNVLNNEIVKKRGQSPKCSTILNENSNKQIKKKGKSSTNILNNNDNGLKNLKNVIIKKRGRPSKSTMLDKGLNHLNNRIMDKQDHLNNKITSNLNKLNKLKDGLIKKRRSSRINERKIRSQLEERELRSINRELTIKKRGRPPKILENLNILDSSEKSIVKKRGRPPKMNTSNHEGFNKTEKSFIKKRSLCCRNKNCRNNYEHWNTKNYVLIKKRGRPRRDTIDCKEWNNINNGYIKKKPRTIIRITKHTEWIGIKNRFVKKRGRPRKNNLSISDHICQHHQAEDSFSEPEDHHLVATPSLNEPKEMSEYEKMRAKRREEMLSMFRELFSADSETIKSDGSNLLKRRKYCRRPLPPSRPRSLRLQGLAPGQRPLRKRRISTPITTSIRCLCCCRLPQHNNVNINSNEWQV